MKQEPSPPEASAKSSKTVNVPSLPGPDSTAQQPQSSLIPPNTGASPLPNNVKPLGRGMARVIAKGYARNPLRELPRNSLCPCQSKKKFKACCLPNLPEIVSEQMAKTYREQMSAPDLRFMTAENEQAMKAEMARRIATCNHNWEDIVTPAVGNLPEVTHSVCKRCMIERKSFEAAQASAKANPPLRSVARGSFTTPELPK